MRTHEEFMMEMVKAHDCEKSNGKIFSISVDNVGNKRCAYCGEIVNYPQPTTEEFLYWIEEASDKPGIKEFVRLGREKFGISQNQEQEEDNGK